MKAFIFALLMSYGFAVHAGSGISVDEVAGRLKNSIEGKLSSKVTLETLNLGDLYNIRAVFNYISPVFRKGEKWPAYIIPERVSATMKVLNVQGDEDCRGLNGRCLARALVAMRETNSCRPIGFYDETCTKEGKARRFMFE